MPTLRFEGYSDDTFGEVTTGEDYDNCASGKPIEFLVTASSPMGEAEGLIVTGQYCPGKAGGWLIGVAPQRHKVDEKHIPAWPMRFERREREYSPALVIEAPEGVTVKHL